MNPRTGRILNEYKARGFSNSASRILNKIASWVYDAAPRDIYTWDDVSANLATTRVSLTTGRLEYDLFNGGLTFATNARYPEEPVSVPVQMKHAFRYGAGTYWHPHLHWLQASAQMPQFLLGYKITNFGMPSVIETDWSNYTFMIPDHNVFTYSSGVLAQMTGFPRIDLSSARLSASIDFVLFRDTAGASSFYAGADPYLDDVTVKYFDSHVQSDQLGSREEYEK